MFSQVSVRSQGGGGEIPLSPVTGPVQIPVSGSVLDWTGGYPPGMDRRYPPDTLRCEWYASCGHTGGLSH